MTAPPTVLVCGSRTWDDAGPILQRLRRLPRNSTILHGGARGADQLAGMIARRLGLSERIITPDWQTHGRAAGIVRNVTMLDTGPDLVLAYWDGGSTGTAHTIREAQRRGIPTEVVTR